MVACGVMRDVLQRRLARLSRLSVSDVAANGLVEIQ